MKTQKCGHRYSSFVTECPHCARIAEEARIETVNERISVAAKAAAEEAVRKFEAERARCAPVYVRPAVPAQRPKSQQQASQEIRNFVLGLILLVVIFGTAIVMSLENLRQANALHLPSRAAGAR